MVHRAIGPNIKDIKPIGSPGSNIVVEIFPFVDKGLPVLVKSSHQACNRSLLWKSVVQRSVWAVRQAAAINGTTWTTLSSWELEQASIGCSGPQTAQRLLLTRLWFNHTDLSICCTHKGNPLMAAQKEKKIGSTFRGRSRQRL